jgi:F-type H+-transporting ATPase subunit delta
VTSGTVAKRYAKALVDVAAEANTLESVGAELDQLVAVWQAEPAVAAFFGNPAIRLADKAETLRRLSVRMALSPLLARFLALLLSRHRLGAVPGVSQTYRDLMHRRLGRVQAAVTTAVPLGPDLQESLRRRLAEELGRTVLLEPRVDPAILGGMVVQVDSMVHDGSLRTQLKQLKEHLLRE